MTISTVPFGGAATSAKINEIIDDVNTASDDIDTLQAFTGGQFLYGIYTPTISALTLGTGGVNQARWWFQPVDPLDPNSEGPLSIEGIVVLGTGGQWTNASDILLPSGFNWVRLPDDPNVGGSTAIAQTHPVGTVYFQSANGGTTNPYLGKLGKTSTTGMRIQRVQTTGGVENVTSNVAATNPYTWAEGDRIRYAACGWAVRV